MKDEKIIQNALQKAEEEVQYLENILAKTITETPQYAYQILDYSIKLSIATERARILSWIMRG
jgi:hypothetical protein